MPDLAGKAQPLGPWEVTCTSAQGGKYPLPGDIERKDSERSSHPFSGPREPAFTCCTQTEFLMCSKMSLGKKIPRAAKSDGGTLSTAVLSLKGLEHKLSSIS